MGHKLLAIRALLIGWTIKVTWMSVFKSTYGRPPWRLFFHEGIETSLLIGLIGVLTMMGSGWIIARTHRAHYRANVLLFISVEVIGGFPTCSAFTIGCSRWAKLSLQCCITLELSDLLLRCGR